MLDLHPHLKALIEADPDLWTKIVPKKAVWQHANGLMLSLNGANSLPAWHIELRMGTMPLSLQIPRTHRGDAESWLTAVLHDLSRWTEALDLDTWQQIARPLAGWLCQQGQSGRFQAMFYRAPWTLRVLDSRSGRILRLQEDPQPLMDRVVPLFERLHTAPPLPGTFDTHQIWTPEKPQAHEEFSCVVSISASMHARMQMIEDFQAARAAVQAR